MTSEKIGAGVKAINHQIQQVLKARKIRSEVKNGEIHFSTLTGFTTHSGENELEGMKILRSGTIRTTKKSETEFEIIFQTDLYGLLTMSIFGGVFCGLLCIFQEDLKSKLVVLVLALALGILIFRLGVKSFQ